VLDVSLRVSARLARTTGRAAIVAALTTMMCAGLAVRPASAGSVMHINDGTAYLFGGEVHPIDSPTVTIKENGAGCPTLVNPMLLILGVPNVTSYAAPSLSLSTGTADLGGTGSTPLGGSYNATTGSAGSMTSASKDVYSFIGLSGANKSNSFTNWSAADLAVNDITVNSFSIFVYELFGTGMTGGNTISATFSTDIPLGTFVVAYGKDSKGKAYSTPFTETGLMNSLPPAPVPEPGSMLLLGSGLALAYARARRKRSR
jgi:hypothetical protein